MRAIRFGDLNGDGPHAPAGAVDQHVSSCRSLDAAEILERDRPGGGHCRGLLEGDVLRLECEAILWRRDELGIGTAVQPSKPGRLAEDFVAGFESRDIPAH